MPLNLKSTGGGSVSLTPAATAVDVNITVPATAGMLVTTGGNSFHGLTATVPTAKSHYSAQTTAAGTAPIKLTNGSLMTTPETGAFEFDGTNLYFTVGGVRKTVTLV